MHLRRAAIKNMAVMTMRGRASIGSMIVSFLDCLDQANKKRMTKKGINNPKKKRKKNMVCK
jgi:hypothetical protein